MRLREILQFEIWSKRTSRRLLLGFVGLMCLFFDCVQLDMHWLTPWERLAAKNALLEIDALKSSATTGREYDEKNRNAEEKVRVAEGRVWTFQDKLIASALRNDLQFCRAGRVENPNHASQELKVTHPEFVESMMEIETSNDAMLHRLLK